MNIEEFRQFCLSLKSTKEGLPFDESTLVFTVCGKIFCLTDIDTFKSINLKCIPEEAIELREKYSSVIPGYHMNKKHWNTVLLDGSIPDSLLKEWIITSYNLVVKSLTKKEQIELQKK